MDALIDPKNPSDFNQAMMDLGAMICTPKNARCQSCPVAKYCEARLADTVALLPVNIKPRTKNEIEYITAVLKYKDKYLMMKNKEGLLLNLYGLIQFEVQSPAAFEDAFYEKYGINVRLTEFGKMVKHVFTHKVWMMNGYIGQITEDPETMLKNNPDMGLYTENELKEIAIPTAHHKVLKLFISF